MPDKVTPRGLRPFEDFYAALQSARFDRHQVEPDGRGREGFEARKQHLLTFYEGVTVCCSFRDSGGQIFDCIPRENQPALRGRTPATPPELIPRKDAAARAEAFAPLREDRADGHGNRMWCPPECVPIRRLSLSEPSYVPTLRGLDRPRARGEAAAQAPGEGGEGHRYAHARQQTPNTGASAFLNVWAPAVGDAEFSVSQFWVSALGPRGLQTVEAGWHVYPAKYRHASPVLFTYWTADGYRFTKAYNGEDGNFVRHSASRPLGLAIDNVSTPGGPQHELQVTLARSAGDWWLYLNGTGPEDAVGYYPAASFGSGPMSKSATTVDFGGETYSLDGLPPMGSGAFAAAGYRRAAFQRDLCFYDMDGAPRPASLTAQQDPQGAYSVDVGSDPSWGRYIYFGGPGGAP